MKYTIDEIRALVANATPGPWGPTVYRGTGLGWDVDGPEAGIRGQFENEADAELIAAAPTLITDLLAELDGPTASDTDEINRLLSDMADLAAERDAAVARADEAEHDLALIRERYARTVASKSRWGTDR